MLNRVQRLIPGVASVRSWAVLGLLAAVLLGLLGMHMLNGAVGTNDRSHAQVVQPVSPVGASPVDRLVDATASASAQTENGEMRILAGTGIGTSGSLPDMLAPMACLLLLVLAFVALVPGRWSSRAAGGLRLPFGHVVGRVVDLIRCWPPAVLPVNRR